ncbi:hypothetical protein BDV96DRAFT_579785 [Lophiotrema nucula]|uniref:Uncharacterized protein n=1 Tax=Lophiotrema nucula TaxID=690887 RepID=A0A6A5Z171_9PLEO|nr:hypothetical protein BDV96DRAFT_579785 [Lophiotrema nucula]
MEKQGRKRMENNIVNANTDTWEDRQRQHAELTRRIQNAQKAKGLEERKAALQLVRQAQADLDSGRTVNHSEDTTRDVEIPESEDVMEEVDATDNVPQRLFTNDDQDISDLELSVNECGDQVELPEDILQLGTVDDAQIASFYVAVKRKIAEVCAAERALADPMNIPDELRPLDRGHWEMYSLEMFWKLNEIPGLVFEYRHADYETRKESRARLVAAGLLIDDNTIQSDIFMHSIYPSSNWNKVLAQEGSFVKGNMGFLIELVFVGRGYLKLRAPKAVIERAIMGSKAPERGDHEMIEFSCIQVLK